MRDALMLKIKISKAALCINNITMVYTKFVMIYNNIGSMLFPSLVIFNEHLLYQKMILFNLHSILAKCNFQNSIIRWYAEAKISYIQFSYTSETGFKMNFHPDLGVQV